MSVLDQLVAVATIVSGVLSLTIILSVVVDGVTRGWVRKQTQGWLGIRELRGDHRDTQVFLLDLGSAHNELADTVCEEHDIPEERHPDSVDTAFYERRLDGSEATQRGDFLRDGDGDD